MLDLVYLEIGEAAHLQDAVFCHGGIPHQISSGLHIVDIRQKPAHVHYGIAHHSQGYIIGYIILIGISKIGFQGVA